ncbi:cytochrome c family protein [Myxococcus virescens]|uniref:cytochrome c family protein n=1 Tax=Myxococcus virescens TaxID=83456 RepID=UPI003DA28175
MPVLQNRVGVALASLLLAAGCARDRASREAPPGGTVAQAETGAPAPARAAPSGAPPQFNCGSQQILELGPEVPPDFSQVVGQEDANCFAWQQFIALNWPESGMDGGTAGFGTPGDLEPVQWQTYMSTGQLFLPDGGAPPAWGTQARITDACLAEAGLSVAQARERLPLMVASKFAENFFPGSANQAFPFDGSPAWLGAPGDTNVWYDVKVNQPEYDYIVDAGLYNAANQLALVDSGVPVVLPQGAYQPAPGSVGAIELKSAWMEVANPSDARWNTYKLSPAVVVDPSTQRCRTATVALVGLHIIHATQSQPSIIWATFEHEANAPDQGTDAGTGAWNFFDAACSPRTLTVPANCAADGTSTEVTVGCEPNVPPPYHIGDGCPGPVPIQVTRLTPIDPMAKRVNQLVQQNIATHFPDSVWKHYVLVNVLWSTNPSPSPTKPAKAPLPFAAPTPSGSVAIANTTMETYIQRTADFGQGPQASNCIVCHRNATLAGKTGIASDFSFVFGLAQGLPPSQAPSLKSMRLTPSEKAAVAHPPTMRRIIQ